MADRSAEAAIGSIACVDIAHNRDDFIHFAPGLGAPIRILLPTADSSARNPLLEFR